MIDKGCNIDGTSFEGESLMRNKSYLIPAALCMAVLFSSCGEKGEEETYVSESVEAVDETEQIIASSDENTEVNQDDSGSTISGTTVIISEDQAYTAVINYCKATDKDFSDEINPDGYSEYWDVSTNEAGEIVVLHRSYTAAQIQYYVDPTTGETYVTELVPGIIDEEQRTGEVFNAMDYLIDSDQQDIQEALPGDSESAPVEYETAPQVLSHYFLYISEHDMIINEQ